jgi:hypothetical protein
LASITEILDLMPRLFKPLNFDWLFLGSTPFACVVVGNKPVAVGDQTKVSRVEGVVMEMGGCRGLLLDGRNEVMAGSDSAGSGGGRGGSAICKRVGVTKRRLKCQ